MKSHCSLLDGNFLIVCVSVALVNMMSTIVIHEVDPLTLQLSFNLVHTQNPHKILKLKYTLLNLQHSSKTCVIATSEFYIPWGNWFWKLELWCGLNATTSQTNPSCMVKCCGSNHKKSKKCHYRPGFSKAGFTLSACPSVCWSVDRIVSASYLPQY